MSTHYVYRAYDPDDVLLYVGCTQRPERRMMGHRCTSAWYSEMSRMEWTGPLPRTEALALETHQIRTLSPVYNITDAPKRYIDGQSLRAVREAKGIERKHLARLTGLTSVYLGVLEAGQKTTSAHSTQGRLASVLGVAIEDFTVPENWHHRGRPAIPEAGAA